MKNLKIRFTSLFIVLLISTISVAQVKPAIDKQTITYAKKENVALKLDKYELKESKLKNKTCVIFMFGGGFISGTRDGSGYVHYFEELARNHYTVISIDYRLGFKNQKTTGDLMAFVPMLQNTIMMAVEDLYDATNFVIGNSAKWGISKDKIIISGSSAGAISVLQAEYEICNKSAVSKKLPADFRYAGVVSFAGAVFSLNGDLNPLQKPAPVMLFHGDADNSVPYGKIAYGPVGFYGSEYIADLLKKNKCPYYFYSVENSDHEQANLPMRNNINEILSFINNFVEKKQPLMIECRVSQIGKPDMNKDFSIMDYIKSNFQF